MDLVRVPLRVRCDDPDPSGVLDLANHLRDEILSADVESVRPATAGPVPAGGKSGEAITAGALVLTLAPVVMDGVMTIVASWLSRQSHDVEIEIDGHRFQGPVTKAQRDEIVAGLLRRLVDE